MTDQSTQSAEAALLGALILDNSTLDDVDVVIGGRGAFASTRHAAVYDAVTSLFSDGVACDAVTLAARLDASGQLEHVGGTNAIVELAESCPSSAAALHYARIVADKSKTRRILTVCEETPRLFSDGALDPMVVLDRMEAALHAIRGERANEGLVPIEEAVRVTMAGVRERVTHDKLGGAPTGFADLDEMTDGLLPGTLTVLAARPSVGKTALALNILDGSASGGWPTALFSMEMDRVKVTQRLLSSAAGVPMELVGRKPRQLTEEQWFDLNAAHARLKAMPVVIDDTTGLTPLQLRAKVRRACRGFGTRVVVVDYLQLMRVPGIDNKTAEVTEISRSLKLIAVECNVAVLALSQLNRATNGVSDGNWRPSLRNLRDSGSIEQDADNVILMHRHDYERDEKWKDENPDKVGVTEAIVAKQRQGRTGVVWLQYDGEHVRFRDGFNPSRRG